MDDIVRIYEIMLSSLTFNSKPIITDLTIIAGEKRAHGEGIADAICSRIIEVPVDQKLPSLYLLDSIVKNIGKEYINYFSARLPEVFCDAYTHVHPSIHPSLRHLFGTWSKVFPLSVLRKIEVQLQLSPSLHGQSLGLGSSRVCKSSLPNHGDLNNLVGDSSGDMVGAEGVSYTGGAGLTISGLEAVKKSLTSSAGVAKFVSPYSTGHGRPLPSLEEFDVRASQSHAGIDYRPSRAMDIKEETIFNNHLKTSAAFKISNSVDLRGTRALINAYGIDEREKKLKPMHQTGGQLEEGNCVSQRARTWQNTEVEEFDWEHMTPALSDRSQIHSSFQPPVNGMTRHSLTANYTDTLYAHGSIDKNTGVPSHVVGTSKSFILPSQQSKNHLKAKGEGLCPEGSSSFTASEQKVPVNGSFPNTNRYSGGFSNDMATLNPTYGSPALEIQSIAEVLANANRPANLPSLHNFPSGSAPPQMQIRGQFSHGNAGNIIADQGVDRTFHFEQHYSRPISMAQVYLPQIRPKPIHLNRQGHAQDSLVQPYFLMPQEVRHNIPPHLPNINASNMSYHISGTSFPSQIRGPFPGKALTLQTAQYYCQVASNPQVRGALSGLVGSSMSQDSVLLNKQDSVGVEFDQEILRVRHESAISALYSELPRQCTSCGLRFNSQDEHSKHMDWHVNKNRTLKNRKTKPSPKWFASVTLWLSGAEALGTEAVPGFLPAEKIVEKEEDEEMAVPADEDQKACALCGEPFEDFYSDDTEEWMYKGATYMYAPAVLTVGMDRSKLGAIVHAKCKSDSHGIPSDDSMKEKRESTEEEGVQRKRLRS